MESSNSIVNLFKAPISKKLQEKIFKRFRSSSEIENYLKTEAEPYRQLMAYYKCALMEVETKFKVLNEEFSIEYERNPIESIKTRMKSPESVLEKLARKNIPFSTEAIEKHIKDIAGIRIICAFPKDIYLLADFLLAQDDVTLVSQKDYIKYPKDNGYRSLHLIVKIPIFLMDEKKEMLVEVQFRTVAMDFWASIEHRIRYKKNLPKGVDLERLSLELKKCAEESALLEAKMDALREELGG